MKILIGVPCMESLPVDYVTSMLQLRKPNGTNIIHQSLSLVYVAREMIAEHALKNNYDYVFFVDSDMVLPADTLEKLLQADKDIISGLAFQRKPPFSPCVYSKLKLGEPGTDSVVNLTEFANKVEEVEGIGLACALIKTEVFRSIYKENMPCFTPIMGYGEDLSFCLRARKLGYKVYADTSAKVGHIGTTIYGEEHWRAQL
jgi:GT2 family glycosyltransferase